MPAENIKADWRADAKCNHYTETMDFMVNAWIDSESQFRSLAKEVCENECPVRDKCVMGAVFNPESYGMRGGFFFEDGALISSERDRLAVEFGVKARLRHRHTVMVKSVQEVGITNGQAG